MNRRILIIASILGVGIGLMVWMAFRHSSGEAPASVTFLGYTNDATGSRLATFVVSNLNSFVVRRQAGYWVELQTSTGGTNQVGRWFSSSHDLKARAFEIVAVPIPTNRASWRVSLSIRTDLGPVPAAIDFVAFIFYGFQTPRFLQRESPEVRSNWIVAN